MTNGARGGELVGSDDVKYCDFHLIASWNCQLSISVHYSKYIVHIIGQIDFLSQKKLRWVSFFFTINAVFLTLFNVHAFPEKQLILMSI